MECGRAAGKHDNKLSAEANLPQDGEADACSQYSVLGRVFNFVIDVPQNLQYSETAVSRMFANQTHQ